MKRSYFLTLSARLLALMATSAAAQVPENLATLAVGERVRIVAPDVTAGKTIGNVTRIDGDALLVMVPGRDETLSFPREKILSLEVSDGPRSRGKDSLIGAGIGAAVGAIVGVSTNSGGSDGYVRISTGTAAGVLAMVGSVLGAFIGVEIPPGERWQPASTASFHVSLAPRLEQGRGLDLLVAF